MKHCAFLLSSLSSHHSISSSSLFCSGTIIALRLDRHLDCKRITAGKFAHAQTHRHRHTHTHSHWHTIMHTIAPVFANLPPGHCICKGISPRGLSSLETQYCQRKERKETYRERDICFIKTAHLFLPLKKHKTAVMSFTIPSDNIRTHFSTSCCCCQPSLWPGPFKTQVLMSHTIRHSSIPLPYPLLSPPLLEENPVSRAAHSPPFPQFPLSFEPAYLPPSLSLSFSHPKNAATQV